MSYLVLDGAGPTVSQPDDPVGWSLKVTRAAPDGGTPNQVCASMLVETETKTGTVTLEWNGVFRLDNHALAGENTALSVLANQWAEGPTWAMQVIAANRSGLDDNILYGIELDLCSPGLDAGNHKQALAIFYGDAFPNTFNPVGAPVRQYAGITINPFIGMDRASLGHGLEMAGHISEGVAVASVGDTAFSAYGQFDRAVLWTAGTQNSPWAIGMGPGQSLKFASGDGNGAAAVWYSGAFTPQYVGAIRFRVDATDVYLPVCVNHP